MSSCFDTTSPSHRCAMGPALSPADAAERELNAVVFRQTSVYDAVLDLEVWPMTYDTIEIHKLTGGCGAEILGVDVKALSNSQWSEVQRAFAEHGVIFFRDQKLTPEQHLAFARRWAPIDV